MAILSNKLLARCRAVLLKDDNFRPDDDLESIFAAEEHAFHFFSLHDANSPDHRINKPVAFLLKKAILQKGQPAFLTFLNRMRIGISKDGDLYTDLDQPGIGVENKNFLFRWEPFNTVYRNSATISALPHDQPDIITDLAKSSLGWLYCKLYAASKMLCLLLEDLSRVLLLFYSELYTMFTMQITNIRVLQSRIVEICLINSISLVGGSDQINFDIF